MLVSAYWIPSRAAFHAVVFFSLRRRHCYLDYCDCVDLYFSMWGMPSGRHHFRNLFNQATSPCNYLVYAPNTMLISRGHVAAAFPKKLDLLFGWSSFASMYHNPSREGSFTFFWTSFIDSYHYAG